MIFERMLLWCDPVKRPGPEAMAVDEWLLESAESPVLRVYGWLGEWGSLGYFGGLDDARRSFPELSWVRRWTGGGTVDHRADWTYTLVVPAREPLASWRGAESYRAIHAALAQCLTAEGLDVRMSAGDESTGATSCFENPVGYDLVGADGRKLAGAGQRRTKRGLLHQGSVAAPCGHAESNARAERLAASMAGDWQAVDCQPPEEIVMEKVRQRYESNPWTARR